MTSADKKIKNGGGGGVCKRLLILTKQHYHGGSSIDILKLNERTRIFSGGFYPLTLNHTPATPTSLEKIK